MLRLAKQRIPRGVDGVEHQPDLEVGDAERISVLMSRTSCPRWARALASSVATMPLPPTVG